jgi:molecular chaperone GrpE (heat shock protein)
MTQDANENPNPETESTEAAQTGAVDERVAKLEAELADSKDRLLRALADTENVRRRGQREREDAQRYAAAAFAKDLLDVADNLRRALASVEGATASAASSRSRESASTIISIRRCSRSRTAASPPAVSCRFSNPAIRCMIAYCGRR